MKSVGGPPAAPGLDSTGVGDGYLDCTLDDGTIDRIKVEKVLYVPTLTGSLLSVKKLTSKGNTVEFTDNQCFIRKNEKLLAVGGLENSLYRLLCKHKTEMASVAKSEINNQNCIHTWQRRLGHRDPNALKRIDKEGLATDIQDQQTTEPQPEGTDSQQPNSDGAKVEEQSENAAPEPVEKEMVLTLDEWTQWKAQQEASRIKAEFNIRKPGEGCAADPQWKKMVVLKKKEKKICSTQMNNIGRQWGALLYHD